MEIRALLERDDRSPFHSGDADLDRFFPQFAGQNQFRHHLGVTYVAVDARDILGFATVAAAHVEIEGLPAAARKKLPAYPLPVLRLARLGVDQAAQRQGLGVQLLRFVLQLALRMADDYGCIGVVVDAKPDAVDHVNAHGTATPQNDQAEARGMRQLFGDRARKIPVTSIKSMVGHCLSAAGAIEAAVLAMSLKDGVIPPTVHYRERDPECDVDVVANVTREQPIRCGVSVSLAFGGNNAALVMRQVQ